MYKNNKLKTIVVYIILPLFIFITGLLYIFSNEKKTYNFYNNERIYLVEDEDIIYFFAEVVKTDGFVYQLINLRGYNWLADYSAFFSKALLADLQDAILYYNPFIFDDIRNKNVNSKYNISDSINVLIEYKDELFPAEQFLKINSNLKETFFIWDIIFLGSKNFDNIALSSVYNDIDCYVCPVFPFEKEVLLKEFQRDSNETGFYLNSQNFPFRKGAKVKIIIQFNQ